MASLFRFLFNIYSVYTARLRYFRFHVRHLDFRQNDTVDFVGDGTIEKPTPENIGVDTKIMFLSCRIAEIDGLPPDSRIFVFVTFSRALAIVRTCIDYHRRRKTEELQVS